ncbi:ATP-dependent exonuclease V subunit alpha [Cyanobium sp.]|nr:ATP-dependent exonuclease V subunit alpha [Cyanobium sp.]
MTSRPDAASPDPTRPDSSPDPATENPSPGTPGEGDDALPGQNPAWLTALQESLVEALPRLYGVPADPVVNEAIAALTLALAAGELECPLPLAWQQGQGTAGADGPDSLARLQRSALVQASDSPLVLAGQRLAWRRWQQRLQQVLDALIERAQAPPPAWPDAAEEPVADQPSAGKAAATKATPAAAPPAAPLDDQQRRAVAAVLAKGLVLLEGGPGTGKTSTVAAMISAVQQHYPQARIHLAAPTGKAAARLGQASGDRHPCSTLHRLLEQRGDRFLRNRHHPLRLDLLIVDEVSMVDLELMAALLEALPANCRLVLVGDPAQLPPVAPGAVLAALQRPAPRTALGDAAVRLETTYRHAGAIAAVAATLRQWGSAEGPDAPTVPGAEGLLELLRPQLECLGQDDNLHWLEVPWTGWSASLPEPVRQRLQQHRLKLAELAELARRAGAQGAGAQGAGAQEAGNQEPADRAAAVQALLAQRDRLLLLTPQRRGPWGVDTLHRLLLGEAAADPARWPCGTPVICLRNRDDLGLANGDLGVVVGDSPATGSESSLDSKLDTKRDFQRWLVFGPDPSQRLHPAQLAGAVEPALALTVHKAQGSEAEEVIVLVPPGEPRDPRLLYTALTRARQRVLLVTGRATGPSHSASNPPL